MPRHLLRLICFLTAGNAQTSKVLFYLGFPSENEENSAVVKIEIEFSSHEKLSLKFSLRIEQEILRNLRENFGFLFSSRKTLRHLVMRNSHAKFSRPTNCRVFKIFKFVYLESRKSLVNANKVL